MTNIIEKKDLHIFKATQSVSLRLIRVSHIFSFERARAPMRFEKARAPYEEIVHSYWSISRAPRQ